jgi:hypothetical protein
MTTQYTTILKLALPVQGELSGTWGDVVNDNITQMVEQAVAGKAVINTWTANSHTLTTADGTTSESRCAILELTDSGAALTGAGTVVCPTNTKLYIVDNNTAEIITVQTAAGTGVAVPVGKTMLVYCDGTNVVEGVTHANSLSLGTSTVTADKILDEDNMASDSATAIATQQSIKAYVDSQVGTVDTLSEILANGNTTGANDIDVDSAQKVQFRDAAIYLNSSVDGQLDIVADTEIQISATTIDVNGTLAFDSLKGTGATTVTNILDEDNMASDSATAIATQQSIKAYVDSQVGSFDTLAEVLAQGNTTGGTDLAVSTGDDITFADSSKAIFGAGSDLQIYHNGSNSYIEDAGTGSLIIRASTATLFQGKTAGESQLTLAENGAVTAYYDNAAKLATTATGIDVTGTGTFSGEITANGGIALGDNDQATFGDGDDLKLYHTGSHSYIDESGTGNLYIGSNNGAGVYIQGSGETLASFVDDGAVTLYHDNSAKLATTATGIDVTGSVTATTATGSASPTPTKITIATSTSASDWSTTAPWGRLAFYSADTSAGGAKEEVTLDVVAAQAAGGVSDFTINTYNSGAKERLRISYDGDVSFYEDTGTTPKFVWSATNERLTLTGSDYQFGIQQGANQPWYTRAVSDGTFRLHINGTGDIITASATGIDVTGTVTADGLTVEGSSTGTLSVVNFLNTDTSANATANRLGLGISNSAGTNYTYIEAKETGVDAYAEMNFYTGSTTRKRLTLGTDGDISFYEDTGTTPKFFWDASEERLGIGTSSPVSKLNTVLVQADNGSASDTTLANSFHHLGGGEYGIGRYYLTTYGYSTAQTNSGAYIGALSMSSTGSAKYDLVFGTRNVTTDTAPTERMRIDASGNVGIGVVPSVWSGGSGVRGLEVGANLAASQDINSIYFSANAYNSPTGWKYRNTQYASNLRMGTNDGVFQFQQAASGTAGAAITWATSMTLDASGRVGIGVSPTGSLHTTVKDSDGSDVFVVAQNTTSNRIAGFKVLDESGTASLVMQYDNGGNVASISNPNNGSLGIYLGGTGAANLLDDYEEGTWTPTLPNGGTLTPETNTCLYTKTGRQVTVTAFVSSVAPTNNASEFLIGGLPFTAISPAYFSGSFGFVGDSVLTGWMPLVLTNSTAIGFRITTGSPDARTNAGYLTAASGSSDRFIITATYFTA